MEVQPRIDQNPNPLDERKFFFFFFDAYSVSTSHEHMGPSVKVLHQTDPRY